MFTESFRHWISLEACMIGPHSKPELNTCVGRAESDGRPRELMTLGFSMGNCAG